MPAYRCTCTPDQDNWCGYCEGRWQSREFAAGDDSRAEAAAADDFYNREP